MSARLSLSDVLLRQEKLIDAMVSELRQTREHMQAQHAETIAALREWIERPQRAASEEVELTRGTTGDHATGVKVKAVTQNGETLEDVDRRAGAVFERRAARSPLPSGAAHAAPLGDWPGAE